jgi:hypothetical protein
MDSFRVPWLRLLRIAFSIVLSAPLAYSWSVDLPEWYSPGMSIWRYVVKPEPFDFVGLLVVGIGINFVICFVAWYYVLGFVKWFRGQPLNAA